MLQQEDFISFLSNPDEAKIPLPKSDDWRNAKDVLHLTDNTFKNEIESKEPVLVMFYAPCIVFALNNH